MDEASLERVIDYIQYIKRLLDHVLVLLVAPRTVEEVMAKIPMELRDSVIVEETDDAFFVKPKVRLSSDDFCKILDRVKALGGDHVSVSKDVVFFKVLKRRG